jgi:hypothetical protein
MANEYALIVHSIFEYLITSCLEEKLPSYDNSTKAYSLGSILLQSASALFFHFEECQLELAVILS